MNVRLQYNLEFAGAVHIDGYLQLNQYQVNLNLETCTTDRAAINIAMERLRLFVNVELANAIYINQSECDLAEILQMIGANVVTLPDDPVDQIVGLMLYCKLNAIMEGMMIVTALDISSLLGDEVWYEHTNEDAIGPFLNQGWWNLATTVHSNLDTIDPGNKVVKVIPDCWSEYGLSWPDAVDKDSAKTHTVEFAKFPIHEH
jgi:hypothetical protein